MSLNASTKETATNAVQLSMTAHCRATTVMPNGIHVSVVVILLLVKISISLTTVPKL